MTAHAKVPSGGGIFGRGHWHAHWFYETGVPEWTRTWGGYPCLHLADMHFPRVYDPRHELDLLKWGAEEIQRALAEVRDRIRELETEPGKKA